MRYAHALGVALLLAGCAVQPDAAVDLTGPIMAAAKGNPDLDSRATWTFHATLSDGVTAARLYDDGLGTYVGGSCGVNAKIFNTTSFSNSGDAVFDPDMDRDNTGCGPRALRAEFIAGSPVTLTPHTNARQVWQMPSGAIRTGVIMGFSAPGATPCGTDARLRYDPAQTGGVRITRLPDQGLARAWEVETEGAHMVGCYKFSKGSYVYQSAHYLPFRVVIVEVPAPVAGW